MRHLIVLSGNSLKNKVWGELVVAEYGPKFDSVFMLQYGHWESGEANIDFSKEEDKLRNHVDTLPANTEVTVMAKSAGSLLAFLSVYHGALTPCHCVFFGIPFDLAATNLFAESWAPIDNFTIPAIAFHNIEDPTTSYEFTKDTLATHAPQITLVTTHESDHWYGDFSNYEKHISGLLLK